MGVTPGGKIGNCTCGIHHRCQNPPKKSRLLCGKNGSFRFLTRLTHYRGRIRSSEPGLLTNFSICEKSTRRRPLGKRPVGAKGMLIFGDRAQDAVSLSISGIPERLAGGRTIPPNQHKETKM